MKIAKCLILLFLFLPLIVHSQCNGTQSFTLSPTPPLTGYTPGTVVTVCYTMNGWNGLSTGSNWLEGFDINLGPGWSNLTPVAAPVNCGGGGGTWLWMNSVTSSATGQTVGPGWFFEGSIGGPTDGNPGNDWGDSGSCNWSFCFKVKVVQTCAPLSLLIQVQSGADGDWGSWSNPSCSTTILTIYNGTINTTLPSIGAMSHN